MKKNAMLKIAAILMVAVLLTTCAISSTFAKYVTTGNDSATARVAAWGVEVKTSLDGIFAKQYAVTKDTSPNVKSLTADMVVAPGTNESINLNATVSGQPEVSVTIKNAVTFAFSDGWTYNDEPYMPIVFTINNVKYAMDPGEGKRAEGVQYSTSIADLVTAINAAASKEVTYAAGTNLDTEATAHDTAIAWAWDYEVSNANKYINDAADTALGNADVKPSITITVVTTVTQTGSAGEGVATESTAASDSGEAGEVDPDSQD